MYTIFGLQRSAKWDEDRAMLRERNSGQGITRRGLMRAALALPAASVLAPLERLTAADVGKALITDIKIRPSATHTQVRVDTDAEPPIERVLETLRDVLHA